LSKFLKSEKPSRLVYKKLVSGKSEPPNKVNKSGRKTSLSQQNKGSTGKRFTKWLFNVQKAQNNFLKKIGLVDSEKCTFCERETEKLAHLFWACPKTQYF